jgi:arylsulfatase A-like enzyme
MKNRIQKPLARRCLGFWLNLALCLSALFATDSTIAGQKPDIVVLLADDLGSYDVSWRGSEIKTPHLDQLAASGAKLEQFYVQPVCSPTRAALMTGRYPMRYGLQVGVIRPWAEYGLPLEERLLPQALREAGYTTAMCGKWHLGSHDKTYWPNARGFDHWYGHLFGALDYFTHVRDGKDDWYRDGQPVKEEGYATHLLARDAVNVIKSQPKEKPLFLYVPFNAVHAPHQVPEKYKEPYADFAEPRRTYAGMLAAMDEAIGQILNTLDETGRRKNALIFFSSDNGGPGPGRVTSNGPLRAGKGTLYEGGVRVVACAAWEGRIKPGSTVNAPMHIADLYPTLLNLAGASLKQKLPLDGMDILPCLTEGKPSPREEILLNTTPNNGALRMGDWKLVFRSNQGGEDAATAAEKKAKKKKRAVAPAGVELFNLAEDPFEKHDLSASHPEKLKALRSRYEALAAQAITPKNLQE